MPDGEEKIAEPKICELIRKWGTRGPEIIIRMLRMTSRAELRLDEIETLQLLSADLTEALKECRETKNCNCSFEPHKHS